MSRLTLLLACLFFILPAPAQTIKKCQDINGKWHYGDHAAAQCEQSRITEINEGGLTIGQSEIPPTQEELDAKQRAEQHLAEQERLEGDQQRIDQRLLNTYDDAQSIIRTRDALIAAINSAIEADQSLKEQLVEEIDRLEAGGGADVTEQTSLLREQTAAFDDAIQSRLTKRELVRQKYDTDFRRYQELTQIVQ